MVIEHIAVQKRPVLRELRISPVQATLQPQLIIPSTLPAAAAWTVAICDNKPSPIALC